MIRPQKVEMRWNPTSRKHYESKGYVYTKHNDIFIVKSEDLAKGSNMLVKVNCDYCDTELNRQYKVYLESIEKSILNKFSCKSCEPVKRIEEFDKKQELGLLTRGENGYWSYKENIEKELAKYLEEHGTIDFVSSTDKKLYGAIKKHKNGSIRDFTDSAGYIWEEISEANSKNYYRNFDNLKNRFLMYIDENGRFPNMSDILNDIGIDGRTISSHGGINEIKRKMNYEDEFDLIDDREYANRSRFEFETAQFLIANKVDYKRDQFIFPNRLITCDFVFPTKDNKEIYMELWGFSDTDKGSAAEKYRKNKKEKMKLYEEFGFNLISLHYEDFLGLGYAEMQKKLTKELKCLEEYNLKVFSDIVFLHPKRLTDEEILDALMELSDDKNSLPIHAALKENGIGHYVKEIKRRHGSYFNFALSFDKHLAFKKIQWDLNKINEAFEYLIENNLPINRRTLIDNGFSSMFNVLKAEFNTVSLVFPKLKFYKEYLNERLHLPIEELNFIINTSQGKKTTSAKLDEESIALANQIVEKFGLHNLQSFSI